MRGCERPGASSERQRTRHKLPCGPSRRSRLVATSRARSVQPLQLHGPAVPLPSLRNPPSVHGALPVRSSLRGSFSWRDDEICVGTSGAGAALASRHRGHGSATLRRLVDRPGRLAFLVGGCSRSHCTSRRTVQARRAACAPARIQVAAARPPAARSPPRRCGRIAHISPANSTARGRVVGAGNQLHARPFQPGITPSNGVVASSPPTAQTAVGDAAATPIG